MPQSENRKPANDKIYEFRRVFEELPNVLIQDANRACWYYIPAQELRNFEAVPDTWTQVDTGTVVFVIPDGDLVEEVPPFIRPGESQPSVLIQYRRGEVAYFLTFEQLNRFARPWESEDVPENNLISFIMPIGHELIEQLPELRRALLQTSTTHS
jgi:hypothetical protein